jgi:hypothetical protein
MQTYDVYVTIHVIGAVAWVGGNTMSTLTSRRVLARNNPEELETFIEDIDYLAPRFFIPISLLTVVFGIVSVWKGPYEFSDPWVGAGLTMFIISFLIGITFLAPQVKKITAAWAAGEGSSAAYLNRVKNVILASRIELVLLWLTVIVMVMKPS